MSQTINNNASVVYTLEGASSSTAISNVLPINYTASGGLTLTKTSDKTTFSAGEIITYTVSITNSSSSYLNGVRIIDNLGGNNLAYVLSSATLTTSSGSYPVTPIATNPLTFTLQQLASGASMTLTYKAQVIFNLPTTVSVITNTVQGIGYPYSGTITGYANNSIQKKTESGFFITKSSSLTDVSTNQTFNYYITLTNNTSSLATITSISDNLPSNFNLTASSIKIGSGAVTSLLATDYTISASNELVVSSVGGADITVPANSTTILTLTGNFS